MTRILVGLLMILFISGQTAAQELELSFELIQSMYEWGMKIYGKIQGFKNPDKSRENIEALMKEVDEVSTKLDNLDTHLDIKLDSMLSTLLADIKLEGALNRLKGMLRHSFSKIDHYFDSSKRYKFGGLFGNQTLKDFSHKALWSSESVPDLLDNIHEAFFPAGVAEFGFLSVLRQRTMVNILHDCDTDVSAQQKVYYIYIQLFIAEIKGLMTQQQCICLQRWFDLSSHDYSAELNLTKTNFEVRLRKYYSLFSREISNFPLEIRRCEVKAPKHGVDILEMEKFSRIAVLDLNYVAGQGCLGCPSKPAHIKNSANSNVTIYNCKRLGTTVTSCPGDPDTRHEYLWWKDKLGNYYGPNTACDKTHPISGGYVNVPPGEGFTGSSLACDVCVCSTVINQLNEDDNSTIWRISVQEQISDIDNDYVVTGIRFVTHDNALHLQIQTARFSVSGMVSHDSGWKDLENDYIDRNIYHIEKTMKYETLNVNRQTLYLDDIKVPDGHVVTGVRFKKIEDFGFKLQVLPSQFDFTTGKVFPYGSTWIDAYNHAIYPADYKRDRTEIFMDSPDDPTRSSEFKYTLESNKMIQFTHTDINKDAGQTTIPLLDAQSVEARPLFPLSGIGIAFRGRERFGGYIAPRIYTLNVTQHLKFPKSRHRVPPTTTTTEKVEYKMVLLGGNSNTPKYDTHYSVQHV